MLTIASGWADRTWEVGIAFGTVGLRKGNTVFEITTYRSEQYGRTSRKPDVQYGTSLEEDLGRRDFTVNAMAARLPGYEFTDPFGGFEALREKVLRTPGPPERSFGDDPLRILRAARFAAKLGFTVAADVRAAMTDQAERLDDRVRRTDHQRADQADADRPIRPSASTSWCRPGWPTRCCPRSPGSGWRPTSTTGTRTSTSTASPCCGRPSRWSRGTGWTVT